MTRLALPLALLLVAGCSSTEGPSRAELPARPGLTAIGFDTDVRTASSRIEAALSQADGVSLVAEVDHAMNAAQVGGTLRPTRVLIFGNPSIGSPLMQVNQLAGLDLPQKMLVYEDASGETVVAYNTTDYLAARYDVGGAATIPTLAGALSSFAQSAGAVGSSLTTPPTGVALEEGVVTERSDADAGETYSRLREAIASNANLTIVAEIDHQANAQSVGFTLRPTRLIVFGNPRLGTPLMEASQSIAIDLPQKMLVYEGAGDQVFVAYNDPGYLAERHGIPASVEEIATIRSALAGLAEVATDRFARR